MNPAHHLIAELKTHGARIELVDGKVRLIHAPGKPPPRTLVEIARKLKSELAEELRPRNDHLRRRSSDEHVRSAQKDPQDAQMLRIRTMSIFMSH
jgi:hypothetical protein